jgi:DNA polymerase-1
LSDNHSWRFISSSEELKYAMTRLAGRELLALDVETDGLDVHKNRVILLTVGDDSLQLVVDCRCCSLEPLAPLLSGPVTKVLHHGAFDLAMLRNLGVRVENVRDTMLNEQILENGRGEGPFSLAALSRKYLKVELPKELRTSFSVEGEISPAQLEYARRDVLATFQILLEQAPRLSADKLAPTAVLEGEAVPAFADLHFDGVYLDGERWAGLVESNRQRQQQIKEELDRHFAPVVSGDLFGNPVINYESEAELRPALEKLCRVRLRELDKNALAALKHPVGKLLVEYREAGKIVSTYGQSFLERIHPRTGRIHADFHQIGAPTGRVSCSDPNLQNIPRGSDFRRCFCAPEGKRMITADYSGCELRILAQSSDDDAFISAFRRGADLHALVATEIFGRTVTKTLNPELRNRAKAINFGLAYGMGAAGLAQVCGMSVEAAEELLQRYFRSFPRVYQYLEDSAAQALRQGWCATIGGRKLWIKEPSGPEERAAALRVAKNMPIQGTNADMLKAAMAAIRRRFIDENLSARMVNCVHDEILVEADEDSVWEAAEVVKEEMIRAGERYITKVPVEVEVLVGDWWQK